MRGAGIQLNTYERGSITISKDFLYLYDTTINLSNIDNMNTFVYPRHSLFAGLGSWLVGFIIMGIVCSIWKNLYLLGDIYIFSIFILIAYNINEFRKKYFGLRIQTSAQRTIYLKSDRKEFIFDIQDIITNAIHNGKANYTINMDRHDIVNNGIISKGNHNKNMVKTHD